MNIILDYVNSFRICELNATYMGYMQLAISEARASKVSQYVIYVIRLQGLIISCCLIYHCCKTLWGQMAGAVASYVGQKMSGILCISWFRIELTRVGLNVGKKKQNNLFWAHFKKIC